MTGVAQRDSLYGFKFREVDRRRAEPGERKTYEIKQMWQRTHEICNLVARGFNYVQVAEILDIHPQTVSNTANSELGMQKIAEVREGRDEDTKKVTEKIRILTDKALTTYNKLFDEDKTDPKLKKDTADTVVLELSGLRVPTRVQAHHISTVLSKGELEEFKERGIKAAREGGLIVDVEEIKEGEIVTEKSAKRILP